MPRASSTQAAIVLAVAVPFLALALAASAPLCSNCVLQQGPLTGCQNGLVATQTIFNIPGACNQVVLNVRLAAGQCAIYEFVSPANIKYSGLSTKNVQLQLYSRAGRYRVQTSGSSSGTVKTPSSYYRLVVQGVKTSTPNLKLNFCAPASGTLSPPLQGRADRAAVVLTGVGERCGGRLHAVDAL